LIEKLPLPLRNVLSKTLTISVFLFPEIACVTAHGKDKDPLIEVYSSQEIITGVTTSRDGRVFFEYPHLDGSSGMRIGEFKNGQVFPYPTPDWNTWAPGHPTNNTFVRTNSLRVGPDGMLWVVDTGTPSFGAKILPGGAKLVAIDLARNQVVRVFELGAFAHEDSFVDDVRFNGHYAFLTDAGRPALIVLDLNTGVGRRVLENATSTTSHRAAVASGKVLHTADGNEVRIHADQMEVSPDGRHLYYQALTGFMYRIETRYLEDTHLKPEFLAQKVEFWTHTPTTGGTAIDSSGVIYLSDVEKRRILAIGPDRETKVLFEDDRLDWPDALWCDHDGYLWLPVAQLDKIAPFNGGHSQVVYPIHIYKLRVAEK
jgi:sugar lactone lactonase YvrE